MKYLGIHLHEKLTWKPHISSKRCQLELKVKNELFNQQVERRLYEDHRLTA